MVATCCCSDRSYIDFSYLSRTKVREPIDINCFISETIARFERENEYDYKVRIQQIYDIQLDRLKIDKAAMEIVLENLLDNAFYSVNPKNNNEAEYSPLIIVKTARHKKTVEFSVQDNGIGIPAKMHQKIFQPFVSFNYGQGIGLYLTKKILSLHRGNIKVESREGYGSKFIFTLPIKPF